MSRRHSDRRERAVISEEKESNEAECLTARTVNIILLGTSGNGKSASGNSIIGEKVFKTSAGSSSVESSVVKSSMKFQGIEINVVDVPGIDTDSSDEVLDKFKSLIDKAFQECPGGFSALVFVLKFGNRFTKEEIKMLNLIKSTLGDSVIENNIICLLTHGDLFDEDMKHDGKSVKFDSWCREQEGQIKKLFEECQYRCVLFNNKTSDRVTQSKQLESLLSFTEEIRTYCKDDFSAADKGRKQVKLKNLASKIMEETQEFLHKKRLKMSEIESNVNVTEQIKELRIILDELKDYNEDISESGCIFTNANNPTNFICALESEIESKVKVKEMKKLQSTAYKVSDIQFKDIGHDRNDGSQTFNRNEKYRSVPIRRKSEHKAPQKQEIDKKDASKAINRNTPLRKTAPPAKMKNRPVQAKQNETKHDKKDKKNCNIL